MQMKLSGPAGRVYLLEASTNLVDWEAVGVGTGQADGSFAFDDPDAATLSNRFYRVRVAVAVAPARLVSKSVPLE